MKKVKTHRIEDMRAEYRRADFPDGLVRSKLAGRIRPKPHAIVDGIVLKPEIAAAFPDSRAVNAALGLILQAARHAHIGPSSGKPARTRRGRQ